MAAKMSRRQVLLGTAAIAVASQTTALGPLMSAPMTATEVMYRLATSSVAWQAAEQRFLEGLSQRMADVLIYGRGLSAQSLVQLQTEKLSLLGATES